MAPLNNALRSQGGSRRLETQSDEDRKFQGMLASSRRPLLHDVKMTPSELLRSLKDLGRARPWIYFCIVGADLRTIRHTLPDDTILQRVDQVGGAIGFLGVTMFRTTLRLFYKPLKRGTETIDKLDRVGRRVIAEALELLQKPLTDPIKGEVTKG